MSSTHRNIVISGWYGQFNAGDDAILDVFVDQARARLDCSITVLSEEPQNIPPTPWLNARFHEICFGRDTPFVLLNGKFLRHFRQIRDCDLFVLGGGGLLRDNTNWRNLFRLLDEIWIAKLFGRKAMLYAIGVGPFKTRMGRWLIGVSARMCDLVTVRSERCAQLLREAGVRPERIHVVSDPAFLLETSVPADPELHALFAGGNKIGFYPTFALLMGYPDDSHLKNLAAGLDLLVESEGAEFVAMPMSVLDDGFDDVRTARLIQGFMKHPEALLIYTKRLSATELKWVTSQARMNITVRLHAMIFSLGCDTPVVAVNYEPKVANVFAEFGAPQYRVEIDEQLPQALARATSACLRELPAYAARIHQRRTASAAGSARTFDLMSGLWDAAPVADRALPRS